MKRNILIYKNKNIRIFLFFVYGCLSKVIQFNKIFFFPGSKELVWRQILPFIELQSWRGPGKAPRLVLAGLAAHSRFLLLAAPAERSRRTMC